MYVEIFSVWIIETIFISGYSKFHLFSFNFIVKYKYISLRDSSNFVSV